MPVAADPVYVSVSNPATADQASQIMRASEGGADVYAVSHLCHTSEGRRAVLLSLRAAGVSPDVARALGWSPGFPEGFEPPAPTRDVSDPEAEPAPVDPNATTVVLERDECLTTEAEAAPATSSGKQSRKR